MGKIKFRVNCYSKNLSEFCSVSDEAMAILIYANNYNQWFYKINNPLPEKTTNEELEVYKKNMPTQRFFLCKKGRGHTYSQDGYKYFNQMCLKIMEDRKNHGNNFDEEFLTHMNDTLQNDKGKRGVKRKKFVKEDTMVRCFVDGESGRGDIPLSNRFENCAS